jgi:hypothetical protein
MHSGIVIMYGRWFQPRTTVVFIRNGGCRKRNAGHVFGRSKFRLGTTRLSLCRVDTVDVPKHPDKTHVKLRGEASPRGGNVADSIL